MDVMPRPLSQFIGPAAVRASEKWLNKANAFRFGFAQASCSALSNAKIGLWGKF